MFKKLYYMASPYSHKDRSIKESRAVSARTNAVELIKKGFNVFSPISYNESWEYDYDVPGDWDFWQDVDKGYISRCDCVLVLTLDGYDKSVGVTAEVEYAKEIGCPVFYISEDDVRSNNLDFLQKFESEDLS